MTRAAVRFVTFFMGEGVLGGVAGACKYGDYTVVNTSRESISNYLIKGSGMPRQCRHLWIWIYQLMIMCWRADIQELTQNRRKRWLTQMFQCSPAGEITSRVYDILEALTLTCILIFLLFHRLRIKSPSGTHRLQQDI